MFSFSLFLPSKLLRVNDHNRSSDPLFHLRFALETNSSVIFQFHPRPLTIGLFLLSHFLRALRSREEIGCQGDHRFRTRCLFRVSFFLPLFTWTIPIIRPSKAPRLSSMTSTPPRYLRIVSIATAGSLPSFSAKFPRRCWTSRLSPPLHLSP